MQDPVPCIVVAANPSSRPAFPTIRIAAKAISVMRCLHGPGDQLSGWKVESMFLRPYVMPYCQVFYTGTVSAPGDPAPLVPAALRGPGIDQVRVRLFSSSTQHL